MSKYNCYITNDIQIQLLYHKSCPNTTVISQTMYIRRYKVNVDVAEFIFFSVSGTQGHDHLSIYFGTDIAVFVFDLLS